MFWCGGHNLDGRVDEICASMRPNIDVEPTKTHTTADSIDSAVFCFVFVFVFGAWWVMMTMECFRGDRSKMSYTRLFTKKKKKTFKKNEFELRKV